MSNDKSKSGCNLEKAKGIMICFSRLEEDLERMKRIFGLFESFTGEPINANSYNVLIDSVYSVYI